MTKGLFDDIIAGKGNRIADAAKLEDINETDIFMVDFSRATASLILSIYVTYSNQPIWTVLGTITLIGIDVFPRVCMKIAVYRLLAKNNEFKPLKFIGWGMRILTAAILPTLIVISITLRSRVCLYIVSALLYLMGVVDQFSSLLTHKYVTKQSSNKEAQ